MAGVLVKKFILSFLFICVVVCILWSGQEQKQLDLVTSIPKSAAGIYFKNTPAIAVDHSGIIYALDNRLSELHIFNPLADTAKTIARHGQGPGDLNAPSLVAVDENRIYVKDSNGISLFNKEGYFEHRFRVYHLTIDLAVNEEKIFLAQAGGPTLITVFDLKGNKISSFGSKYSIDYDLYKEWSPQLTDRVINAGRILFSPNDIYFVSTIFAAVFKYDKNGHFVSRQKLVPEKLVKEIENLFFRIGLKDNKNSGYSFFNDISYFEGNFFGSVHRKMIPKSLGDIIKIDEKNLKICETYRFPEEEMITNWKIMNICIRKGDNGQPQFYISYYDEKLAEFKVSIFQEREEKK